MLFQYCNKTFLLLTETTSEILQTTLPSYLIIVQCTLYSVHRKNVSLVSKEIKMCEVGTVKINNGRNELKNSLKQN